MNPILAAGAAIVFGLFGGTLSGMFGIGGGIVTTPLIRIFLDASAISAVATPLVAIIPSTLTGSYHYLRARIADWRVGLLAGGAGALLSAFGALLVERVGGSVALVATAVVILWAAADTIESLVHDRREAASAVAGAATSEPAGDSAADDADAAAGADNSAASDPAVSDPAPLAPLGRREKLIALGTGAFAGLYSGFLGLGGGFLIVPLLRRGLNMTQRQAVGTSLMAVAILAIPGTVTHALLGNIDWPVALGLAVGVIPGATLGAKLMVRSSERTAKVTFALLMVALGVWLAVNEVAHLG